MIRLQNTPPKGAGQAQGVTKTERLIKHICGLGTDGNMKPIGIRTAALAEATGVPANSIQVLLEPHVKKGTLVVCKITSPTGRTEREYRAGPGVPPPEFAPLTTKRRAFQLGLAHIAASGQPAALTPRQDATAIEPPVFINPTQPAVVKARKTPAAGGAADPPRAAPAVAAQATPGPTPRAALKKEPAAVKAPAGDVRIGINDSGTLVIAIDDEALELDPKQARKLGHFMAGTHGVWNPF